MPWSWVLGVALLLLAEGAVRWLDAHGRLKAQPEWGVLERLRQVDDGLKADAHPALVILGDSTVGALDQAKGALSEAIDGKSFAIVSIPGASTAAARYTLEAVVLERVRPQVVVYGISTQAVNQNGLRARQTPAVIAEVRDLADGALGWDWVLFQHDHVALYRNQWTLRDWAYYPWRVRLEPERRQSATDPQRTPKPWTLKSTPQVFEAEAHALFGEASAEDLRAMATRCRDVDVLLVFAAMPLPEEYGGYWPDGWETYRRHEARLRDLAKELDVPLVDLHALRLSRTDFKDSHHLAPEGATKANRALGKALREAGLLP